MSSQTSLVAEQVRLQQWAAQIQDCKNRPADMKVETWCSEHGITKANYYYRMTEVRKACLEQTSIQMPEQAIRPFCIGKIPKHMDDHNLEFCEVLLPWSEKLPAECRKA